MTLVKKAAKDGYDAAIIGVGQAGDPLAKKLVEEGYRIAVIEKDRVGGSCVNYGCTPSKAMISSARVAYTLKKSQEWGIHSTITKLDFDLMCERRDRLVSSFRNHIREFLENTEAIDFFRGSASFSGKKEITVDLHEGGKTTLKADRIFINTGTHPSIPDVKGIDQVGYFHSKNWVNIKTLPESLVVIGGGYAGVELAQMFRRIGSKVVIVQDSDQLLPREDSDIAGEMNHILTGEGIEILLKSKLEQVRKADNKYNEVILASHDESIKRKATHILVAAGTVPATRDLNLDAAGIETDERGYIRVNEKLQTSVQDIYALGDCKGGPEFTHISYDDYRIVADHLFGDDRRKVSDRPVPWTLFTDPELGRIGINEKTARHDNIAYRTAVIEASQIARARETGQTRGKIKVLVGEDDKILGAAVLSAQGGEIMSMIQIAMMGGMTFPKLRDGVFAHPTFAESLNNLFMTL